MKRILAFILLICVVLNTVLVSATENQTVETGDYSRVLTVFEYLDALNGQSLDEIDVTQSITRAEFVSICVKALNLPAENGEKIFYDVDEETICFQAVSYLVQAGVLSVDSDREFRPNEDISYSEALKILLCLAGYDAYANENGGYPAGYVLVASKLNLTYGRENGVFNKNDFLINTVLNLTPEVITIHNHKRVENKEFIKTLKELYEDNLIFS